MTGCESCPDCGRTDPCFRCRIDTHMANPHNDPDFRDGAKPCRCSGQRIEEHQLINGAFVCQMETQI